MTNAGLSIRLPVLPTCQHNGFFVLLQARPRRSSKYRKLVVAVRLEGPQKGNILYAARQKTPGRPIILEDATTPNYMIEEQSILVTNKPQSRPAWQFANNDDFRVVEWTRGISDISSDRFSEECNRVMLLFDSQAKKMWKDPPLGLASFDGLVGIAGLEHQSRDEHAMAKSFLSSKCFHIQGTTAHSGRVPVFLFISIKTMVATGIMHPYCQLFIYPKDFAGAEFKVEKGEALRDHKEVLSALSHQVLKAEWGQPAYYHEDIDMSFMIDMANARCRSEGGMPFLWISQGRRELKEDHFGYKYLRHGKQEGRGDSVVATTGSYETVPFPSVGRLKIPTARSFLEL